MRFQLLGNPEVHAGGQAFPAGSPKQGAVLAALLVDANQPLSVDVLVDRVWGDEPHDRAQRTLHTYVSRIRRLLRHAASADPSAATSVRLHHRAGGYLLQVPWERVDLHRFRRLMAQALRLDEQDPARLVLLREAMALWTGQPLAGISGDWAARVKTGLQGERIDAVVAWADGELRAGNAAGVVAPLTVVTDEHPLVEPLTAALMRALHAVGRSADALSRFLAVRRRLIDELGVEPGTALQHAQQLILRADAAVAAGPDRADDAGWTDGVGRSVVPAQLPLDVHCFVGRRTELARLDAVLRTGDEHPTALAVALVSGTAGVGKSALVVHWAHRVRPRFPDGQLYVDLRGFDPGGSALGPAAAVRGFLTAFGVPADRIPADLDSRVALYRSILADRRVLVVIDNAGAERDVRPLLPGAPHCMAVVASRNHLAGLVAAEGARPVVLGLLPASDARALLAGRIDATRMAADPEAVDAIVTACARLPLALTVAAARAVTQPELPLHLLADELRDMRTRLDAFAEEDSATDVRAVLSWSYQTLEPAAARLFRLVGLHIGPDLALPAAASLHGGGAAETRQLLRTLTRGSLLIDHRPGRYTMHDLLRTYAAELALATEGTAQLQAARRRMLEHYLRSAHAADRILHPYREPIPLDPAGPGVMVDVPGDRTTAMAWFVAEHQVLVGAVRHAYDVGLDTLAWQLAWTLTTFLDLQGHWHDWVTTQRIALAATTRTGDRAAQAFAHRNLGLAHAQLGAFEDADHHLRRALDLYSALDDAAGQAHTHNTLARAQGSRGRPRAALRETQQAIELFRLAGHHAGQARALNNVGWYHALLGENEQALLRCQEALRLHQRIGDRYGEANTRDSLGFVHHRLGRYQAAVEHYHTALDLWREVGDRYNEADTLIRLGDTHAATGELDGSRAAWQRALEILVELGHADVAEVRTKLDALPVPDGARGA